MSRRKKKKEEHENAERWLLTYADMITLLVAFFMMMYSMSVINLEKFKQAAIGIRSGFNGAALQGKDSGESIIERGSRPVMIENPKPIILPPKEKVTMDQQISKANKAKEKELRARRVGALVEKINHSLAGVAKSKSTRILAENKGVSIELIGDMIFFPKNSTDLSDEAKHVLKAVASVLGQVPNEISVEGHTSATDKAAGYSTSWELSTARATGVVKFLLSSSTIDPRRVGVTGYGEYRPMPGETKPSAAVPNNDRVRVFIFQD